MGVIAFAGHTPSGGPSNACLCSLYIPNNQTYLSYLDTGQILQAFLTSQRLDKCHLVPCPMTCLGCHRNHPGMPRAQTWMLILLDLVPERSQKFASGPISFQVSGHRGPLGQRPTGRSWAQRRPAPPL